MRKILLIIGILLIIVFASVCAWTWGNTTNNDNSAQYANKIANVSQSEVKITDPVDNQTVSQFYTVKGTCSLKPDERLEVFVKPEGFGWWVQEDPEITGNSWETRAQFGEQGDSGMSFRVLAIVTTKDISEGEYKGTPKYNISDNMIVTRE